MTSLRARLAALLVAAIVAVVLVAAGVIFRILGGPPDERVIEAIFVRQAVAISTLIGGSPERARAAGVEIGPPPAADNRLAGDTLSLDPLRPRSGPEMRIVRTPTGGMSIAFPLTEREWAYVPYLGFPTRPFLVLAAYLGLVVLGAIAISLYAASRLIGSLQVLETALTRVRPDGTLAPIPEEGPAEVKATARALNTLSLRLSHAMESRMRLVAAAGHDLRTPLTRMRLRAEFLPERGRETWLRDLAELDAIADSAIRLVREEVAPGARAKVPLRPLLAGIAHDLAEIGLRADFDAAAGLEVTVRGEAGALKRAFANLAENAAHHGLGGEIRLERHGSDAVIVMEDRGPGIPETLIDQVFEPFFRVDPARGKPDGGAGLGLAIAREIVERHGGTIAIRNREGGGLRQEVRLPEG